jgi:hypothetical protein
MQLNEKEFYIKFLNLPCLCHVIKRLYVEHPVIFLSMKNFFPHNKLQLRNFFFYFVQESSSPSPSLDTPSQDAIALKKALEWELALDSRDLRSHAWYHGPIPRQRAEEFLRSDGDFLVRDCVSQPGNYVLSCKAKGQILHFVINKVKYF